MDLLKIDVDSIPHDALLVALLSSGLRAKAGTGYHLHLPIHRRRCQFGTAPAFCTAPRPGAPHGDRPMVSTTRAVLARLCINLKSSQISNYVETHYMKIKTHFSNRLSVSFSSGKLDMLRFFQTPPIYLSAYLRLFFSFH